MKKILILTLIIAASVPSGAQLQWDARIGANVSQFSEGDAGMKLGLKAGVTAEYAFSDLFALRPGLYFSMKGSSGDTKFAADFPSAYNLSYIEIPVLASLRFRVTDGFKLALNAGPYFAYRINGKPEGLVGTKAFDMGAEAGLDFVFGKFAFGPAVQYGLTRTARFGDRKLHNINYSLTFGFRF